MIWPPVAGFDSKTLLDFKPPSLVCLQCRALLPPFEGVPYNPKVSTLWRELWCPVCGFKFLPGEGRAALVEPEVQRLLSSISEPPGEKYTLEFDNAIEHARALALSAVTGQPLDWLLSALLQARAFVHFATYSLDLAMVGVLGLASRRVQVAGVIGVAHETVEDELERMSLTGIKVYGKNRFGDVPHQKLVVVDGLLAFKGSANMSVSAWHKAGLAQQEMVEAVTAIDEVRTLNNNYFAPQWLSLNKWGKAEMRVDEDPRWALYGPPETEGPSSRG